MNVLDWLRGPPLVARIAPLTTDHAADLARLHATAFARPWDGVEFERLLADRAVIGDGVFLARAPEPVGFVLSRIVADEAEILTVAMGPQARGRGQGRPLLEQHLDALVRRGVRVVHLEVEEGNAPALALYRRLAFTEVGRREGYYAKPDGRRAAALTMSRIV